MTRPTTRTATGYHLYDLATGDHIGPATPEQVEASLEAEEVDGGGGGILVAEDGRVVFDGSWEAQQPGVRSAYVV